MCLRNRIEIVGNVRNRWPKTASDRKDRPLCRLPKPTVFGIFPHRVVDGSIFAEYFVWTCVAGPGRDLPVRCCARGRTSANVAFW